MPTPSRVPCAYLALNFGCCGDARVLADLAAESEAAGWDGFFVADHLQWPGFEPAVDPWIALAAIAMRTERIAIGTNVTPLPRRDVVKLARETVSVDRLSGGRLILGVGLGYDRLPEWSGFGHETDARVRGAMLDEGLDVLAALWCGAPVDHRGAHFQVQCEAFAPPLQQPRIPVWVAGLWPSRKPFRRAAKWDGVSAMSSSWDAGGVLSVADLRDIRAFVAAAGNDRADFEIVVTGATTGPGDSSRVEELAAAGLTWWLEMAPSFQQTLDDIRSRIRKGPPTPSQASDA
ncbi:MAG: LLM class flavin-dependent oxidoreductase [Gammaproteobacteria bacterium]